MSRNTTLKRIAAVAVAALGLGMLSVVPASALADETRNLTVFAANPSPVDVGAGSAATAVVYVASSGALGATKGFTVTATETGKPAGATSPTIVAAAPAAGNVDGTVFKHTGTTANTSTVTKPSATVLQSTGNGTSGGTPGTIAAGVGTKFGEFSFTGFDKPGTYTFEITPDGAGTDTPATITIYAGQINPAVTMVMTADAASNNGGTSAPYRQGSAISGVVRINPVSGNMLTGDKVTTAITITNPQGTDVTSTATFATSAANTAAAAALDSHAIPSTSGSSFILTATAGAVALNQAYPVGTFTLPATATTIAGTYVVTSSTTFTAADGTLTVIGTKTEIAAGNIFVSGTSVTQGTTRGYNGAAVVGNVATVTWFTPTHANSAVYRIIPTGVGSVSAVAQGAGTATSITPISGVTGNWNSGAIYTTAAATTTESATLTLTSAAAGDQTISVYTVDSTTGLLTLVATSYVRWGDSQVATTATSRAFIAAGSTCAAASDTLPVRLPRTASTAVQATICLTINDAAGVAANGIPVSVSISGPGLISLASGTTASAGSVRAASLTATAQAATNRAIVGISADGTAGVGTITITAGAASFTRTVNFYGAVATLEATQNLKIARASSTGATLGCALNACDSSGGVNSQTAGTPAVVVVAKDSAGNVVPGLTLQAVSSDSTVIGSANIVEANGAATALDNSSYGPGSYLVSLVSAPGGVSGKSATVTFRTMLSTGAFISAAPLTFTLGGSATGGTVTMALDKKTYAPGEKMVLTYTAKDSSGNPVADGTAAPTATASKAVTGSMAGVQYINGSAIIGDEAGENLFAPAVDGAFTLTAASGTATGATITTTATVNDTASTTAANAAADAAAEAIDAANAATDAANLAAEAADAATVAAEEARDAADAATAAVEKLAADIASLTAAVKAQITTLANTVAKIAKKVKA